VKLFNLSKNKIVVGNLIIAKSYSDRMRGLLGRTSIDDNEGLLIKNCNWIHMFFMKFPIDVIFLRTEKCHSEPRKERGKLRAESRDASLSRINYSFYGFNFMIDYTDKGIYKVVRIIENIKPWRISSPVFRADSVLEIKSETAKNIISIDDELKIMEDL